MSPLNFSQGYRAVVVMKIPRPVDKLVPFSVSLHDTMAANPRYAGLAAKLLNLKNANSALSDSQYGFKCKPPTVSKAKRDADAKEVRSNIKIIAGSVQEMADLDPENAVAIISEASFGVKEIAIPQKQKNTVIDGPESGSVIIIGEGQGPHNFRMSSDGTNWTVLTGSKDSRKILKGLPVGKTLYFQTSKALKNGEEGEWSQTLSIVVR